MSESKKDEIVKKNQKSWSGWVVGSGGEKNDIG